MKTKEEILEDYCSIKVRQAIDSQTSFFPYGKENRPLNIIEQPLISIAQALKAMEEYAKDYVVANDSEEAYRKVRKFLDKEDMGFSKERELDKIELLAEDYQYTNTQYMLFL